MTVLLTGFEAFEELPYNPTAWLVESLEDDPPIEGLRTAILPVAYDEAEALIDELVAHGKQFEMMAYPGRTHGIGEGRGTRKHLFTTMTGFLLEHLPPGP